MKANRMKVKLAMARACMNLSDLAEVAQLPRPTVINALAGKSVRTATIGRIARALGVDVSELIETEE